MAANPEKIIDGAAANDDATAPSQLPSVRITRLATTVSGQILTKRYVAKDGALVKIPSGAFSAGIAKAIELPLDKLNDGLLPTEANVYGLPVVPPRDDGTWTITTKQHHQPDDLDRGCITRSRGCFEFAAGPTPILLDSDDNTDCHPPLPATHPRMLLRVLEQIMPQVSTAAMVAFPSASAGIYLSDGDTPDDGQCGWHTYLVAADGRDIPRFGEALSVHLALAGHLSVKITKDGKRLARTLIDGTVFQPERIDFLATAETGAGVMRSTIKPLIEPGGVLDTYALVVTDDDRERYEKIVTEAFAAVKPQADEQAETFKKESIQKLLDGNPGMARELATYSVERMADTGILPLEWPIQFDDGTVATVAEIAEDTARFNWKSCHDPIEPEKGAGKAMVLLEAKSPRIFSFVHGGRAWVLQRSGDRISDDPAVESAVRRLASMKEADAERELPSVGKDIGLGVLVLRNLVKTARKRMRDEQERREQEEARRRGEQFGTHTQGGPMAWVREMNEQYFPTLLKSKMVVAALQFDEVMERDHWNFLNFDTFRQMFCSQYGMVGFDASGQPISGQKSEWLTMPSRAPNRKFYFDPSKPPKVDRRGYLNLWTGLNLRGDATKGSSDLMLQHIEEVICAGDKEKLEYVMGWLAYLFQYPGHRHEVALVLLGEKGAGKGSLGQLLCDIFGTHGIHLLHAKHLVGHFNMHLLNVAFVFADESFFHGDVQGQSVLKGLITEPTFSVEPKGIDLFQAKNALSILMATNELHAVMATDKERRYAVMEVSPHRVGDREYFDRLVAWKQDPDNVAAFVEHLMLMDISAFNPRNFPETRELAEQRLHSLDATAKWWLDCLSRGSVVPNGHTWHETVTSAALHDSQILWCDDHKRSTYDRQTEVAIGGWFCRNRLGGTKRKKRTGENPLIRIQRYGSSTEAQVLSDSMEPNDRPRVHPLGSLEDARKAFIDRFKLPADLFSDEEEDFSDLV